MTTETTENGPRKLVISASLLDMRKPDDAPDDKLPEIEALVQLTRDTFINVRAIYQKTGDKVVPTLFLHRLIEDEEGNQDTEALCYLPLATFEDRKFHNGLHNSGWLLKLIGPTWERLRQEKRKQVHSDTSTEAPVGTSGEDIEAPEF